jgi:hypothetical protein
MMALIVDPLPLQEYYDLYKYDWFIDDVRDVILYPKPQLTGMPESITEVKAKITSLDLLDLAGTSSNVNLEEVDVAYNIWIESLQGYDLLTGWILEDASQKFIITRTSRVHFATQWQVLCLRER